MELIVLDLRRNFEKCLRVGSHRAGKNYARHDVILIPDSTEREDVRLCGGLKNSQSGRVSVVNDQVRPLADLRQSRLFCRPHVIEFPDVADQQASFWSHRKEAALKTFKGQPNRRQFNTAYRPYDSALGDSASEHAFSIRRLIEFEG